MKVVSAFRPFPPESIEHQNIGAFDWLAALKMAQTSVVASCGAQAYAITDVDTDLPVPSYQFATTHRRLMLWILDVSLRYLESSAFDQDTIFMSPDVLMVGNPAAFCRGDLAVVVRFREKFLHKRPLLNGIQFWRHAAKAPLVRFYARALALAVQLPADLLRWGADTVPLVQLLEPFTPGTHDREGLQVSFADELRTVSGLASSELTRPLKRDGVVPFLDFKYRRKAAMDTYFHAHFGSAVQA